MVIDKIIHILYIFLLLGLFFSLYEIFWKSISRSYQLEMRGRMRGRKGYVRQFFEKLARE